jgi:hypothetical protein
MLDMAAVALASLPSLCVRNDKSPSVRLIRTALAGRKPMNASCRRMFWSYSVVAMIAMGGAAHAGPLVTIGANFAGCNLNTCPSIPPDTNGAVGPDHFVEFLNGGYRVYDKSGAVLQQSNLFDFWSSAGVTPIGPFDPRVLFDPMSQRWFASSADNQGPPSNILLAVSKTSDPTQGWRAVTTIPSDSTPGFFDFPRLGINQDGVYLAAGVRNTIVAIPKSDLLGGAPTAANATVIANTAGTGPTAQPAVAPQSSGAEPLLSIFGSPEPPGFSTLLKGSSIDGPITSPTLDTADRLISVSPYQNPFSAIQKATSVLILAGDAGFSSSVVSQNGRLFGVQTIKTSENGRSELRWVEIAIHLRTQSF